MNDDTRFITLHKKSIDITGQKFGRLLVLGPVARKRPGAIMWLCRCDCGNTATIVSANIRMGVAKSCGCLQKEKAAKTKTTHGLSYEPLYTIWADVVRRCTKPNSSHYKNYGARGISVFPEWQNDCTAFYAYISKLEHCQEVGYSLDRIDNNGNYEPGNVRFATRLEQSHNSRRARLITHDGKTMCIADWARSIGMKPATLAQRLRQNMTIEDALTLALRP